MKIIGNHGPGTSPTRTGSGIDTQKVPFGWVQITLEANEEAFLPTVDLFGHEHVMFQGIFCQALSGSFTVDATLAPADLAINPEQAAGASWVSDIAGLVPGTITKMKNPATALRITNGGTKGILVIAGV